MIKTTILLIGLYYRIPNSSKENNEQLLGSFKEMVKKNNMQHLMIMGDFNYPSIDFDTGSVNAGINSEDYRFMNMIQDLFLTQNVKEPTRISGDKRPSLLDYIFTNEENLVEDLSYELPIGKSDHVSMIWTLKLEKEVVNEQQNEKLNYYRGNYTEIRAELEAIDWDSKLKECGDLESMWRFYSERVLESVNKWVPKKPNKKNCKSTK